MGIAIAACAAPSTGNGDGGGAFVCPEGWTSDAYSDGGCRPSDDVTRQSRAAVQTGIVGFARLTTGTCNLCEPCSCDARLVADVEVRVYAAADVDEARRGFCTDDGLPPEPLARTTTDARGLYGLRLGDGDYVIVGIDPHGDARERCDLWRSVTVASDVIVVPFAFDHGAY